MTKRVKDLMRWLSDLDPDLIVGIASDEEGNSVHPLYEYGFGIYDEDGDRGDTFRVWSVVDEETEEYETVKRADATAIVLWP